MKVEITKQLNSIFENASKSANKQRHDYVSTEHIFLELIKTDEVKQIFHSLEVDVALIEKNLNIYMQHMEKIPKDFKQNATETDALKSIINTMLIQITASEKPKATTLDMFVALFYDNSSYSYKLLERFNVTKGSVLEEVSHEMPEKKEGKKTDFLDKFCVNLSQLAKDGKIDNVIGRDEEIKRMSQILCRRKKNNPLLMGEAGVGKTAIVEGMAISINNNKVPKILQNNIIFALNIGNLVSGTKYRGDFEKRLKGIVAELVKHKNAILFIDEIHTLIGSGSVNGNSLDGANILKPFLARGDIKCIGATTFSEYKQNFEKDKAMTRRFSNVHIDEPSLDHCLEILKGLKGNYESFHNVKFSDEILKNIVSLSHSYIKDRFLPDKAIDIMDEVGSLSHIENKGNKKITNKDIELVVSKIANVPTKSMNKNEKSQIKGLKSKLAKKIFGQNEAIEQVSKYITISKAGLKKENKPIASFLFTGPTGVGKTELAKSIANTLDIAFIRYDMAEFMEGHSVSKFIGSPAGYVGYDDGGKLIDDIKKTPHCVVLFDEVEKAHLDVINIFLQIMDNAKITDNNGNVASFEHTIVIMTSNITSNNNTLMGFNKDESISNDRNIKSFFSNEFINRLSIINFNHLSKIHIDKMVDKLIQQMEGMLEHTKIKITKKAKERISDKGYSKEYGARFLERFLDDNISFIISEKILYSKEKTNNILIDLDDNEFVIK
jgi:ATP-dependent Clp protease ATP-binding subunit ClpA